MKYFLGLMACVISAQGVPRPEKLSETGLYKNILTKEIARDSRPYAPQYPLWTDGAAKKRWVFLPEGKKIIADNPDQWEFPVGTKFWKEFSFQGKRVETRFIEKNEVGDWSFSSYLWNLSETEALLAPEGGVPDYIPIQNGLKHSIPSVVDCLRCHKKQGDGVLGFDALQLSNDRDPNALHAEALETNSVLLKNLIDENRFNTVPLEFKNGNIRIPASTDVARTVYGYMHSNCASCHSKHGNSSHVQMNLAFELDKEIEQSLPAFSNTVNKRCVVFQFPNEPLGMRIVKKDPDKSVLYRMFTSPDTGHMPPIGTVVRDEKAVEKIREWILGL